MKRAIAILAVLVLSASMHAQPISPFLPGRTLDPVDGVTGIAWQNGADVDMVVVLLERDDCRSPALATVDGPANQAIVQVPDGPPFDPRCLLRTGDHVWLLRFRNGRYIDQLGPYVVPNRIWLPVVGRSWQ